MIVDLDSTVAKVRATAEQQEGESDDNFNSRILHTALLAIENGKAEMKPEDKKEENEL
jgi:hypothetical protein